MRPRVLIRRIARAPARWRRRRAIHRVAASLRSFGVVLPPSEWRLYRQLLRSHRRFGQAVLASALTTVEMNERLRRFGQAMKEAERA